jgi:hypothetical protein
MMSSARGGQRRDLDLDLAMVWIGGGRLEMTCGANLHREKKDRKLDLTSGSHKVFQKYPKYITSMLYVFFNH